MFSKINKEFSKHTKAFQAVLLVVIVVPFVIMLPGVDIFQTNRNVKPDSIGTIAGVSVDWDEYNSQGRRLLARYALRGNILVINKARDILGDESFYGDVLNYIGDQKIINSHKDFPTQKVSATDMKEFLKKDLIVNLKKQEAQYGPQSYLAHLNRVRRTFQFGGDEIDEIVKEIIIEERFNDYIKAQNKPTEEAIIATVKKEERTYKLRTVKIKAADFADEPLKEYYEKNKANYREENAIKVSLVPFHYSNFSADFDKKDFNLERLKFISDALQKISSKEKIVIDAAQKDATEKFKEMKLKAMAAAKAKIFEAAVRRSLTKVKGADKVVAEFKKIAKSTKYTAQDSSFVNKDDLTPGKFFFADEELTKSILSVTAQKPLAYSEGLNACYVLVFNAKGSFTPFEEVRNDILAEVYKEKLDNYYVTNREMFKQEKRYTVGLVEFFSKDLIPEVPTEEEIKSVYDGDAKYKNLQRKLIQFSLPLGKEAKDVDKKVAEESLKTFVKSLEGKSSAEVAVVALKKEDGIVKQDLSWIEENSFAAGLDPDINSESFKAEVSKFTKVFVRKDMVAVIFVAAQREMTPYQEVKTKIKSLLSSKKQDEAIQKNADAFYAKLKSVKPATVENINKAIAEYQKDNKLNIRDITNVPFIDRSRRLSPQEQQMQQMQIYYSLSSQKIDSREKMSLVTSVSEDFAFTRVKRMPPTNHRAVTFLKEVFPESYEAKDSAKVKERIFQTLNTKESENLASEQAAETKEKLEKEKDSKKLIELLGTKNFKVVEDVKFKDADSSVKEALKDAPVVGAITTNFNSSTKLIVYVESVKEVTDEEIAKLRPEHEKKLTEEMQNKELNSFWETKRKALSIEVVKTEVPLES